MLSHVIIINGYPRSGKDTVVALAEDLLCEEVHNVSTVDRVKAAAKALGWKGEKSAEWRSFLHELKMLWTNEFDGPFGYVVDTASKLRQQPGLHVMFVHSREPAEISRFHRYFNDSYFGLSTKCSTLLVKRSGAEQFDNYADSNVENGEYEHVIVNPDIENWEAALREGVKDFLKTIGLEV